MLRREPDPRDEMFEVLDGRGEPTGEVCSRAEVHRLGHWHRSFHCWLVCRDQTGEPVILFQRRSLNKDTAGGLLDVAVGGHYRAGEGLEEVYREFQEELGLHVAPEDLTFIGVRVATGHGPGYIDREVQDVHVHVLREKIATSRPAYEEITALVTVVLVDLERLFTGGHAAVPCVRYPVTPGNQLLPPEPMTIGRDDFVQVRDNYWIAGARTAADVLKGVPDPVLRLDQ